MSFYISDEGEDSNISGNISEICESPFSSTQLLVPRISTSSASTPEPRLNLLDGTFFKYLPESSTPNNIVALCMKCFPQNTEVKGYNNCSSNFLSHLKRKHGEDCVEEYKNYIKMKKKEKLSGRANATSSIRMPKTIEQPNKQTKSLTQEQFDENIVRYFIHSMIPLRTIEDPYFLKIFSDLNISDVDLKIISRQTLKYYIEYYYSQEIADIKSKLHEIDHVCTTLEICSSKKLSFLGVTAHWITKELRRMSVAIACRSFKGTYSYNRISELVLEINSDFDLAVNKIVATINDNDGKFVNAFKMFGVQLTNIDTVDCDEDVPDLILSDSDDLKEKEIVDDSDSMESCLLPENLRSCANTLSLCAIDANKILKDKSTPLSNIHNCVIKKCNCLWKTAGQPKTAEIIQYILQRTLSRPSGKRWTSLFDSLQQIFLIKEKNVQLHKALNLSECIKDTEFAYLEEYLMCTTPVAEALDILQSENNTYYGIVLPCLFALRKKLREIERKNNFTYCKMLIGTYLQSIERRFSQFYDLTTPESENAAIAALSYPRFKNKWLSCVEPTQRSKVLHIFKTIISKEINEKPEATATAKNTKEQNTFFNFESDSDTENFETQSNRSSDIPLTKAELLMLHFFAEENQELEILDRYPEIKNVFMKHNTPLSSSAQVERLFPFATMTNLPNSHQISDQMFEKRVVLKANMNYKKL